MAMALTLAATPTRAVKRGRNAGGVGSQGRRRSPRLRDSDDVSDSVEVRLELKKGHTKKGR